MAIDEIGLRTHKFVGKNFIRNLWKVQEKHNFKQEYKEN